MLMMNLADVMTAWGFHLARILEVQ